MLYKMDVYIILLPINLISLINQFNYKYNKKQNLYLSTVYMYYR